jgi:uncharacterized membrane protein
MSCASILSTKGVEKLNRMEMCSKVSVEYTGPKPFTFLGVAVLGGLGAVFGALRGGVLGAIVLSMLGATIGATIGYAADIIFEALIHPTHQSLKATMNYDNRG